MVPRLRDPPPVISDRLTGFVNALTSVVEASGEDEKRIFAEGKPLLQQLIRQLADSNINNFQRFTLLMIFSKFL